MAQTKLPTSGRKLMTQRTNIRKTGTHRPTPNNRINLDAHLLDRAYVPACSVGRAAAAPIEAKDVRVIDGDTIRVFQKQPNVRLVGFNAPETRRAACQAERELEGKATGRVRDLVRDGALDFEFVACACRPGTELTPACNLAPLRDAEVEWS
jgi:endonuclease YncB( thermonuclease family)